jgi:two-component system phosphate regulon sensor histidine kinase PhoR
MKKRIVVFCTLLTMAALAIAGVISSFAVEQRYLKEVRIFLLGSMDASMSSPMAESAYDAAARDKAEKIGNGVRITVIAADGRVLGDSEAEAASMPNHLDRSEVKAAIKSGVGENIRYSDTVRKTLIYVAKKYDAGVIVRFSMPLENEQIFMRDILPSVIIAGIIALIVALAAVNLLMRQILKPFYNLQSVFDNILKGKPAALPPPDYAELSPIVEQLNRMADRFNDYIASIRAQTEKIDNIIRHMQEGLVMLDGSAQVLLSNEAARNFLHIESDMNGKNFFHLVRQKKILDAVKQTIEEKKPTVLEIRPKHGKNEVVRILLSPVQKSPGAIMLLSDITEIMRAENMRREFTANVSHELKTPLTTIRGFAELIAEGMVQDKETLNKYAMLIKIESERLITLINDILRLSELEETAIPVHLEKVNLLECAKDVAELLRDNAQKRNVLLNVWGENACILAMQDSMKELVLNLADNAIKYNLENGRVDIHITKRGQKAVITVEDTGIGIPMEHQDRIFERFYRVDKGRSKKTGGTGLGLSIVKHITELYKGEIRLTSEVGKGSCFEISFMLYNQS